MKSKSRHPLYGVWRRMLNRCHNPKCDRYRFYGNRGIRVSDQWHIFENFIRDMGPRPFPRATIERIQNSEGYQLGNCRWATQKEQARNTCANLVLQANGKRQCVSAWAEELGVSPHRIYARKKLGWSDDDALFVPRTETMIDFLGTKKPLRTWAKIAGIKPGTLWFRLRKGWPVSAALLTPTLTPSEAARFHFKNHPDETL